MTAICAFRSGSASTDVSAHVRRMLHRMERFGTTHSVLCANDTDVAVSLGARSDGPTDVPENMQSSADRTLMLVADARIDNRAELAGALRIPIGAVRCMSDSALILAAYEAWGEDCARRLVGDFAFILWNARRRSLFCARDPLGQRVLYVRRMRDGTAVASSIAALIEIGTTGPRLNEQKVADTLVLFEDPRSTYYEGIERIPPAHAVVLGDGSTSKRYHRFEDAAPLVLSDDAAYIDAFHAVFDEAVQARLRDTDKVGIMLSAGLDSSTVAAFAARALASSGMRLSAYHSAPAGPEGGARAGWIGDESNQVREIADRYDNIDLTVLRRVPRTPLDGLDDLFEFAGGPVRNPNALAWVEAIHLAARDDGVRTMLTGQKGNSTISFTGLRMLRDLARNGHRNAAIREARAVARRRGLRASDVIRDQILRPLVPPALRRARARLLGRHRPDAGPLAYGAIAPDFAREMKVLERLRDHYADEERIDRAGAFEYRTLALAATGNAGDALQSFRERFGIEHRDPTCDLRVVDFCLSLPASQFLRDGRDRRLIRHGMHGLLPDSVLDRTERGAQGADWGDWLQRARPEFETEIERLERNETAGRCLDLPRLRKLIDAWPERFGPQHNTEYNLMLLRAIVMGRFIRWFEERYS